MYTSYVSNGVTIVPNVITKGDRASIKYNGLLYNSGADSVFLRVGFGNNWTNLHDIQMHKTLDGFEATIPVTNSADRLNIAFKDSANNWDNNSGTNYTFDIQ